MNKKMNKKSIIIAIVVVVLVFAAIGSKGKKKKEEDATTIARSTTTTEDAANISTKEATTEKITGITKTDVVSIVSAISGKYELKIETSDSAGEWIIVQIYGDSEDDFVEMKNAFSEIARDLEKSYSNSELSDIFDKYIGNEDGIDGKGNIYRFIFSAPNEYEDWWRVDIYVNVDKDAEEIADKTEESDDDNNVPKEYKSALKKAKVYSDTLHMSKTAIHEQLTSEYGEKFSEEAADYAMENLVADYKENALKKAEDYSEMMYMSKAGIYDQLTSEYGERFTDEEAQYAVDNLVADYKKNALKKAKDYQEMMDMSPSAIYDQLVSDYGEKFTDEEAQYAIDNLE